MKSISQAVTVAFVLIGRFLVAACLAQEVNPAVPKIPSHDFDLVSFGAVADGRTLNTLAFNKAASAIAAAGGGRLVVPKGTFLTLPFSMTSHMELHLEEGAVIQFPDDVAAYGLSARPTTKQMKDFKERCSALITGKDLSDISITGSGIIDGGGAAWWTLAAVSKDASEHTDGSSRPRLLVLTGVHRLAIQGITLRNSPRYNLVLDQCHDAVIDGVHIIDPAKSPNTDGIDPIGSDTVLIRDCDLDVGDDNIAIKAIGGPAANILVENCRCKNGRGISIGSETYMGIHDVTVRDCTFDGTVHGLHIKSARDRGNQLFNFSFSNITMTNVPQPLIINLYYADKTGAAVRTMEVVTKTTPFLHDVTISNFTATGATSAGEIIGLPESPVKNVTLTNVKISAQKGVVVADAQGVVFDNVKIDVQSGETVTSDHADVTGK